MTEQATNDNFNVTEAAELLGRFPTDIIRYLASYPGAQQQLAEAVAEARQARDLALAA